MIPSSIYINFKLIFIIFLCFLIIGCNKNEKENTSFDTKNKSTQNEYPNKNTDLSTISSLDNAKTSAVGTWQFTESVGRQEAGSIEWDKLIIKEGGTFDYYQAVPHDGKWSFESQGTWDVGTDRFEDTGKKYYYIYISFKFKNLSGINNWRLVYKDPNTIYSFNFSMFNSGFGKKTDKNPWQD